MFCLKKNTLAILAGNWESVYNLCLYQFLCIKFQNFAIFVVKNTLVYSICYSICYFSWNYFKKLAKRQWYFFNKMFKNNIAFIFVINFLLNIQLCRVDKDKVGLFKYICTYSLRVGEARGFSHRSRWSKWGNANTRPFDEIVLLSWQSKTPISDIKTKISTNYVIVIIIIIKSLFFLLIFI